MDGTIINIPPDELSELIYSNYIGLNVKIIEEYNLDLSLFYKKFRIPNTKISEIPIEKLDILIDKMGVIIENSNNQKNYVFDIYSIKEFIARTKERILQELRYINKTQKD